MIKLFQGDCLEVMKNIPDKTFNLICIDPPYNIGKDTWDRIENYVEWMGKVFKECERLLKNNGSFYWFHNDFLKIVDLQNWLNNNSKFIFKQFIVWNKRFDGCSNKGFLDGFVETNQLRNYQKMAEYILYYTFQDETGLTTIMLDINNFSSLRKYFKSLQEWLNSTKKYIIDKIGQNADHCFRWKSSQWDLPTKETYQQLINIFNINKWKEYKEYESLRQEYESLRYPYNNQKIHHSVWNYDIAEKIGHITPKPVELIKNVVLHSSNEGDLVLDCFAGSGTTGAACQCLNRNCVLIENDNRYIPIIEERLNIKKENHEFMQNIA